MASTRIALGGALLLSVGAGLIGFALLPHPAPEAQGRQLTPESREHVEEGQAITYHNRPPSSGPHYPRTLRYGVFERPADPGYWIHTLEHGGIVVLYNCDQACPTVVSALRQVYAEAPRSQRHGVVKISAVPYSDMDHKLSVLAWGWIDEFDVVDCDRILAFYRVHVDQGPEDVL